LNYPVGLEHLKVTEQNVCEKSVRLNAFTTHDLKLRKRKRRERTSDLRVDTFIFGVELPSWSRTVWV
jgi:hypothetical protein